MIAVGMASVGCYELSRTDVSTVPLGSPVAFDVTDAGRVALGGAMGPEIDRVEGRLIQRDNGEYLLGVTGVSLLHGAGYQTWSGERVQLKPTYVGTAYERKLAVGKTVLLSALGAGALAVIASRGFNTGGSADDTKPPGKGDTAQSNRRLPRNVHVPLFSINISRIPLLGRP